MHLQPTLNIGMLGHVANGKTVVTRQLTGKNTQEHSEDKKLNRTVHLGYASCKIWHCPTCDTWRSSDSKTMTGLAGGCAPKSCEHCLGAMELKKHISIVDCPGHNTLMTTMLNGTAVMDAVIFVVTPDGFPKPQTEEHYLAKEILGFDKVIVCMNKLDLLDKAGAQRFYAKVKAFFGDKYPIIPISAIWNCNLDVLCKKISEIPEPERKLDDPLEMIVIRSFDVNKPGCDMKRLQGGVAGGSILSGRIRIGDEIEIRPGLINRRMGMTYRPFRTTVTALMSDTNKLQMAEPGGLIAVGTTMDPSMFKNNKFVGQVIGTPGKMPDVYKVLRVKYEIIKKVVGLKDGTCLGVDGLAEGQSIKIQKGDELKINVNSSDVDVRVTDIDRKKREWQLELLNLPICIQVGKRVSVSKKYGDSLRLIGMGIVLGGTISEAVI